MSYADNFGVVPRPIYAGPGARLAACAVDCALVWYVTKTVLATAGALDLPAQAVLAVASRPVALLIYLIAFEGGVGATLGKMMLQMRVRDATGRPIGFGRAAARNVCKLASLAPVGLGLLPCLFAGRRQALHDWLADCVVVRA